MASSKNKLDEKHLKILRELVSLQHNKQCFDCQQKGPTYVNMTIGSFVCTSCSGILRGITPQHRVKSISMASFSTDEIEFIKSHGNELCRQVWLGLYDSRSLPQPDSREEQKVREFMSQKYEKKRWYIAPTDSMKQEARQVTEALLTSKQSNNRSLKLRNFAANNIKLEVDSNKITTAKPSAPTASTVTTTVTSSSTNQPPKPNTTIDLLGDLGGDIFSTPAPAPGNSAGDNSFTGQSAFANFTSFTSPVPPLSVTSQPVVTTAAVVTMTDKYAALLNLDPNSNVAAQAPTMGPINWSSMSGNAPNAASTGWMPSLPPSQHQSNVSWDGQVAPQWTAPPTNAASYSANSSGNIFPVASSGINPFAAAGLMTSSSVNPFGVPAPSMPSNVPNPGWAANESAFSGVPFQMGQFQGHTTIANNAFTGQFAGGMQPATGAFPSQNGVSGFPSMMPVQQNQQFVKPTSQPSSWTPTVPSGNPFMAAAMQQQQFPPRANPNNPFL